MGLPGVVAWGARGEVPCRRSTPAGPPLSLLLPWLEGLPCLEGEVLDSRVQLFNCRKTPLALPMHATCSTRPMLCPIAPELSTGDDGLGPGAQLVAARSLG